MVDRFHRTQVLLEPEQHRALTEMARREGRSVSALLREMIRLRIDPRNRAAEEARRKHLAQLETIRTHRAAALAELGGRPIDVDVVALLQTMRDERDAAVVIGTI
jgi:predicted transcriptional regulator